MALPAIDDFSGSNGQALTTYSANWTYSIGAFIINSAFGTVAADVVSQECGAYWNADSFANDQYSEAVIDSVNNGDSYIGVGVRMSAGGNYYGAYSNNVGSTLFKLVDGSYTELDTGPLFEASDVVRLEVIGTSLKVYLNDEEIMSATDSTHSSGAAGIIGYSNQGNDITSWEGGDLGEGDTQVSVSPITGALSVSGLTPSVNPFDSIVLRGTLVNEAGSPLANLTNISCLVWYGSTPSGAPDESLSSLTTNSNGSYSFDLALGGLAFGDSVYRVIYMGDPPTRNQAGRRIPSYESV